MLRHMSFNRGQQPLKIGSKLLVKCEKGWLQWESTFSVIDIQAGKDGEGTASPSVVAWVLSTLPDPPRRVKRNASWRNGLTAGTGPHLLTLFLFDITLNFFNHLVASNYAPALINPKICFFYTIILHGLKVRP